MPIKAEIPTPDSRAHHDGFLSEVQVCGEGVFEHMHNQVSEKHQYRRRHRQRQAFRKHLEKTVPNMIPI